MNWRRYTRISGPHFDASIVICFTHAFSAFFYTHLMTINKKLNQTQKTKVCCKCFSKRTIPHCISFATLFGLPCLALSHRLQSYNIASIDPRYVYSSRKLMVPPLGAHFASFDVSDTISRVFSFKSTLPSFIAHNVCVNVLEKSVTFYTDSAPKVAHYEHFASTYHLAKMLPRYKHSVVKGTMPNTTIINSPAYLALFDFDNANPYHWAMRLFFSVWCPV